MKSIIPASEAHSEILVANSRFIATLAPVFSVEEPRDFIARIRSEFSDASHNVPAFIIGHGASVITHCSDAGEPSGTAGRPALAVLAGSGLGDVAVSALFPGRLPALPRRTDRVISQYHSAGNCRDRRGHRSHSNPNWRSFCFPV